MPLSFRDCMKPVIKWERGWAWQIPLLIVRICPVHVSLSNVLTSNVGKRNGAVLGVIGREVAQTSVSIVSVSLSQSQSRQGK